MKRFISLIGIILLVWANAALAHGERRSSLARWAMGGIQHVDHRRGA